MVGGREAGPGPGVVGLGGVAGREVTGGAGFAMVGLGGGGVLAPLGREEVGTLPPPAWPGLGALGRGGAVGAAPPPAAITPPGRALGRGILGGLGPGGKAGVAVDVPVGVKGRGGATGGEARAGCCGAMRPTPAGGIPGGLPGGLGTWGLGGVEDIGTPVARYINWGRG